MDARARLDEAVAALQKNTDLTTLSLRGSRIGDQGAERLAAALEKNTGLRTLDLTFNKIGDQGAEHLAAALLQNTGLTTLDLKMNQIGDHGAERLAEALEQNTGLTSLNLNSNSISIQGAVRLADALEQNTGLTTLDLENNSSISNLIPGRLDGIDAALERNRAGVLVLTISCECQGPERCAITCTKMGGSQLVLTDLKPQQTVSFLRNAIAEQLGHGGHLRLVCRDGTLLNDEAAIGDCFRVEFHQAFIFV